MRHLIWVCALAASASVASGQVPDTVPRRSTALRAPADSGGLQIPPDCVHPAGGTPALRGSDSLCLTRREAIDSALTRNPQLRAGAEQVAQARARKVQGTALPDPAFSYEYSEATGLFGSGRAQDKVVSASLTVPFPDKFRLQNRIGRADVRSTEASLTSLRQIIAAQTSQTYDSLLAVLRRRWNLEAAKQLADDFLRKTEARFQAGTTARLDVIRARVDVAQAANDLIASERDVANARSALNRLIDRPLGAPIAVSDSLALPAQLPPLELLESAALSSRPELTGLQRQQEGARATTTLAREFWLPDLSFGVVHNYADPGPGVLFTGLSMPLPVFFWQHTKGEIAEARHRELELAASYRDLQAEIGQDVRNAYTTAATALRQATYIRDELLPAAREAYRIASVSYGLGGSSALEVLEARRALQDAENQYTEALAAANMARADLERAVAAPLEQFGTGGSRND